MADNKPKQQNQLRTPQPKKKLGLSVPPALRLPHEDLIHPPTENDTPPSQTTQTRPTSQPSHTRQTRHSTKQEQRPISPERDFTKVANSIGREAVPAGMFKGKSKQLYDALYSLTRGAIVPARSVRISRPKLMTRAHIGARVTFDSNVEHLVAVGLLKVTSISGEHEGNEYEVLLPEEIGLPSLTRQSSQTSPAQKVDTLVGLESSQSRQGSNVEMAGGSQEPKTFSNTSFLKTDDDEAFAGFVDELRKAEVEITGREPGAAESERYRELAQVLVTELRIAAARTTVSSVPSFFAEHLRRRLFKKDKAQLVAETASTGDAVASQPFSQLDISKCPDCGGSGMYYPEGFEKGVARCKHERLNREGN